MSEDETKGTGYESDELDESSLSDGLNGSTETADEMEPAELRGWGSLRLGGRKRGRRLVSAEVSIGSTKTTPEQRLLILGVSTWLVVVTLDPSVARWAARPIPTFHGGALAPLVIGPEAIPREVDGASLELMVLATMAHGQEPVGGVLAVRALSQLREAGSSGQLDGVRMRLYTDLVLASIDEIARSYVEATMIDIKNWEPQSDFAKHWKAEGKAEGRRSTLRNLVRLKFRELATADVLARLDAADDGALTRIEERLLSSSSIDELFG